MAAWRKPRTDARGGPTARSADRHRPHELPIGIRARAGSFVKGRDQDGEAQRRARVHGRSRPAHGAQASSRTCGQDRKGTGAFVRG